MIKLTVDASVEEALRRAFPKPASSARRVLDKYIRQLEVMLFEAMQRGQTPQQRKLKLYPISLQKLANRGGQIGPQKIRVHAWLRDNDLELVKTVVKGSNLSGEFSNVKLTSLVQMTNTLMLEEKKLSSELKDSEIDAYLCGDDVSNFDLFDLLYPDFQLNWNATEVSEIFDPVTIDQESIKNYIIWLSTKADWIGKEKKDLAIRQARIILAVASVTDGVYLQRRKPSIFGRTYYEGTSVQNVNKELRRAMLGNCWEYDIRSSVVAWKMGFAQSYLDDHGLTQDLNQHFSATLCYLENKADFMATVRHFTFTKNSAVEKNFQLKLLKQAFTAISFGARQTSKGWKTDAGEWNNPALVEILKSSEDRARFLADSNVQAFIREQNTLDSYLFNVIKQQMPQLLDQPHLQTSSGRPSKAKVLAYLYQHGETQVMDIVREIAQAAERIPIANVHDAIFFKRKLSLDLRHEIELQMHERTGNPFWHLSASEQKRFESRDFDALTLEHEHKNRMQEEEDFSSLYAKRLSQTLSTKSPFEAYGVLNQ